MVLLSDRNQGELSDEQAEPRPAHLRSLTGMRFIAALAVFGVHCAFIYPFVSPDAQSVFESIVWQGGFAGVGFFFVLSGFVLAWSARPGDRARAFWRRRILKIYPNHLVTFAAAAILFAAVLNVTFDTRYGILNALLVQSWFPQVEIRTAFNAPAWSLACEALFYLSFPLLMRWINRIRPERLWAWAGAVVAGIVTVATVAMILPSGPFFPLAGMYETELYVVHQLPATRMLDFVFGILLARIVMTGRKLPLGLGASAALAVAAYVAASLSDSVYSVSAIMIVPLGLVIAAGARADTGGRPSWLGSRIMVWLGNVSFAFYMWHSLVVLFVHTWLGAPSSSLPVALAEIALLFAITLTLAGLQYSLIERPIMRRFAVSRRAARR